MLIDSPPKRGRLGAQADITVHHVGPIMKAKIELIDLGDAKKETKQILPIAIFFDSFWGIGLLPDL
jgi:hypothetical protein